MFGPCYQLRAALFQSDGAQPNVNANAAAALTALQAFDITTVPWGQVYAATYIDTAREFGGYATSVTDTTYGLNTLESPPSINVQLFINYESGGNVAISGGFLAQATGYAIPVYIWRFIHTQIRVICPGAWDGNITFFDWSNVGVTQFLDWDLISNPLSWQSTAALTPNSCTEVSQSGCAGVLDVPLPGDIATLPDLSASQPAGTFNTDFCVNVLSAGTCDDPP